MYRVYQLLTDDNGNIVHKTPIARCRTLAIATSHARVWGNGWECGIYELTDNGEILVARV
jgi:hypothetical protein